MSAILISRFLLDLRHKSAHPNGITSRAFSLTSLQAASYQLQNAILDDFGDPMLTQRTNAEIALEDIQTGGSADPEGEEGTPTSPNIESGGTLDGFRIRQASPIPIRTDHEEEV